MVVFQVVQYHKYSSCSPNYETIYLTRKSAQEECDRLNKIREDCNHYVEVKTLEER